MNSDTMVYVASLDVAVSFDWSKSGVHISDQVMKRRTETHAADDVAQMTASVVLDARMEA